MRYALLLLVILLGGCYSFKGVSIPDGAGYFTVLDFDNKAYQVVPGLAEDFAELLRNEIRNNTSLSYTNDPDKADLIFRGFIQEYRTTSRAPQADQQVAINQLTMAVHVEYADAHNEKNGWSRNFNRQEEYPADQNFLDIRDQINQSLTKQLVEDIFNAAFTEKW